jgi:hypothetical protein
VGWGDIAGCRVQGGEGLDHLVTGGADNLYRRTGLEVVLEAGEGVAEGAGRGAGSG